MSPAGDVLEGVVGDTVANVRINEALMKGCDPARRRDVDVRRVAMSGDCRWIDRFEAYKQLK